MTGVGMILGTAAYMAPRAGARLRRSSPSKFKFRIGGTNTTGGAQEKRLNAFDLVVTYLF